MGGVLNNVPGKCAVWGQGPSQNNIVIERHHTGLTQRVN